VCRSAVNRYCRNAGYTAGLGITEFTPTTAYFGCMKAGGIGAKIEDGTFQELKTQQGLCDVGNAYGGLCITAVSRYCGARGYVSGYGLHEIAANGLSARFVCLSATSDAVNDPPLDTLSYVQPSSSTVFRTAPPPPATGHELDIFAPPDIGQPGDLVIRKFGNDEAFELYRTDASYIWLWADFSNSTPYFFEEPWLKRWQRAGETYDQNPFTVWRQATPNTCDFSTPMSFKYTTKVVEHRVMSWGGAVGTVDTLVFTYTYPDGTGGYQYETNYYALGFGWVQWELRDTFNNLLVPVQTFTAASTGSDFQPPYSCGLFPG
jgi:hypothetical protein